jgi:hypothetical protein
MIYKSGDIITDANGNSVEILELCGERYTGRRIGESNDRAAWSADASQIDAMALDILTLEKRIDAAKERFNRLTGSGENAENAAFVIARLEAMR